jgi:hypothetical protein
LAKVKKKQRNAAILFISLNCEEHSLPELSQPTVQNMSVFKGKLAGLG